MADRHLQNIVRGVSESGTGGVENLAMTSQDADRYHGSPKKIALVHTNPKAGSSNIGYCLSLDLLHRRYCSFQVQGRFRASSIDEAVPGFQVKSYGSAQTAPKSEAT